MRILDLDDNNKIIISPEALGLAFFKGLWSRDKSKDKEKAYMDISYVFYFSDFNSPFFNNPPDQRDGLIKKFVFKDDSYKADKEVLEAIKAYEEINKTPAMEMLEAVMIAIDKMKTYFKTVDYENDDPNKVSRLITDMPKMIAAVNEAKEACRKESLGSIKVRGSATVGLFENKEE